MSALYRVPGQHFGGKHESGADITYDWRESHEGEPPAGWFATLEEAVAARFAPAPVAAASASEVVLSPAVDPSLDDVPPTREELEAKAAELGIKVDKRWGDRRLMQELTKALEG